MIIRTWLPLLLLPIASGGVPVASDSADSISDQPAFLTTYRSTIQIIWTCLTIVFASTWVCVHPHVAGYKATRLQRWGLRGRLFINALLYPDRFVRRAFAEWMGCRMLYARMKERAVPLKLPRPLPSGKPAWTHVHAHFIQMGGVVFRQRCVQIGIEDAPMTEKNDIRPRSPGDDANVSISEAATTPSPALGNSEGKQKPDDKWFKNFNVWDNEDIKGFFDLELTKDQIEDRSKADGLSKAFVVMQCLWFVVQSIGRASYGLPLTELEVTCLAFIACNIGMYAFWWYKPLNVVCPVEIERPSGRPTRQGDAEVPQSPLGAFKWMISAVVVLWTGDVGYLIYPSAVHSGDFKLIDSASQTFPVNHYYTRMGEYSEEALQKEWGTPAWLAYAVIPAVFGALHSIAWDGAFPTAFERLIWRISCWVPAIHVALYVTGVLVRSNPPPLWTDHLHRSDKDVFGFLAALYFFLSTPINFAARFVFVVLPLFQLRHLPPLAHQTVPWSDFLPHV